MSRSILSSVNQLAEAIWSETKVWPEYAAILQQVMTSDQIEEALGDSGPTRWYNLPQLCCQAAGGDSFSANSVTAAWLIFHLAADIMDAIEDGDPPDEWWANKGPGYALNVASGLYFTASLALNNLYQTDKINYRKARGIVNETYQSFLRMSSGQHLDLATQEPTLEQCWKIASLKSGAFFAAGCRAGARLATEEPLSLDEYEKFGFHLGLLIQILDDLDEIEALRQPLQKEKPVSLFRSIAVAFSLDVLPPIKQDYLREVLQVFPEQPERAQEAWELIEASGVGLYLRIEIERHRSLALEALARAHPALAAKEMLISMVNNFVS